MEELALVAKLGGEESSVIGFTGLSRLDNHVNLVNPVENKFCVSRGCLYGLAPDTPESEIVSHLMKMYQEMQA